MTVSGKSILDLLWEKLDALVDKIKEDGAGYEDYDTGHALGLAEGIAFIEDPYSQDVDDVRTEAMRRWQERQGSS